MRLTDDQIGAAIDAVVEALHTDGITVDVSSVRAGDGTLLTVTIEGAGEEPPHATDGEPCWCTPAVETVGGETETVLLAPAHRTPLMSSYERMHLLSENCWCLPNVLAEGQGEDFRILEIDHRGQIAVGDRVAVDDPALAELRRIMREAIGEEPPPNNEGVVDEAHGDMLIINFDDGVGAPYPLSETRRIA